MRRPILILAFAAAISALAEETLVTTLIRKDVDTGDKLVSTSSAVDSVLPDVGTPIFHFDATQTENWQFADEAKTQVTKVPSLVGDRYAHFKNDGGGGNWSAEGWPLSPVLVNDPSLGGKPCLDFGELCSHRGLVFNSVYVNEGDNAKSNILENIGTVFMVFNSEKGGGGGLLGGGAINYGERVSANVWKRNVSLVGNATWDFSKPSTTLARWYNGGVWDCAHPFFYSGVVRQDGLPSYPVGAGLNGAWQVLTIVPTGLLNASGFSLGPTANGSDGSLSGGQRIAEVIIYDSILDDNSIVRIENYLRQKWFGTVKSWDKGSSRIEFLRGARKVDETYFSNGAVIEAAVNGGESMEIGKLVGGRGGFPALVKTGEGSLTLEDATSYQGTLRLAGGTLKVPRKSVPAQLPEGVIAHFDSSVKDSIAFSEENGTNFITRWESVANCTLKGNDEGSIQTKLAAVPRLDSNYNYDFRPWVNTNSFGGKFWTVDFGFTKHYWGPCLKLIDAESKKDFVVKGVSTALVVVNVQALGGYLLGGNPNASQSASFFDPADNDPYGYNGWGVWRLANVSQKGGAQGPSSVCAASNTHVFVNGIRRDGASGRLGTGYMTPGWQVVALKGAGSRITSLGGLWSVYYGGGCELAEVVMYHRALSEEEIKDASAFLSKKWFGRETSGYSAVASRGGVADIPKLETIEASTLEVPEGSVVRIGEVNALAKLRKTGKGILEVVSVSDGENIIVEEGEVKVVAAIEHEGELEPAADPAAWFDANDIIDSWCLVNDDIQVAFWHDKNGRNVAWNNNNLPALIKNGLNGMPVVDFGKFGTAKFLRFGTPLDGVRSIFAVGDYYENAPLLGNYSDGGFDNTYFNDFTRNNAPGQTLLAANDYNYHVYAGSVFVDGVRTNYNWRATENVFNLIEYHTLKGAHGSAFSYQQINSQARKNGARLAEVIIYERELTEREKIATRNYLMKKWFNAEPIALPDNPPVKPMSIANANVSGKHQIDAPADINCAVLTGEGVVEKTGEGILAVENIDRFAGTVEVAEGGLKLNLKAPNEIAPSLPTEGRIAHFSADWGVVSQADFSGYEKVTSWESVLGDGVKAVSYNRGEVLFIKDALDGKPIIKMDPSVDYKNANLMVFNDASGNDMLMDGIKSVLWVIGSQEGGGYLLGGGTNAANAAARYNFHRGGAAGALAGDPLLSGAAHNAVQKGEWAINGKSVDPLVQGLSGGWDVVSFVIADGGQFTSADGFAADGRTILSPLDYSVRAGRQRLAEVIFYNRRLTENEVRAAEVYLSQKWNVHAPAVSAENRLSVELHEGTTLQMGELKHLASLGGEGVVVGDVNPKRLVVDFALDGFLTVNGTIEISDGFELELKNLSSASDSDGWVKLVDVANIIGSEKIRAFNLVGEPLPNSKKLLVRLRKDGIWIKLGKRGCSIIIR